MDLVKEMKEDLEEDLEEFDDNWLSDWSEVKPSVDVKTVKVETTIKVQEDLSDSHGERSTASERETESSDQCPSYDDGGSVDAGNDLEDVGISGPKVESPQSCGVQKRDAKKRGQRTPSKGARRFLAEICENAPVSESLVGLCKFKCPKCDFQSANWENLGSHLRKSGHDMLSIANIDKFLIQAVAYLCKICSTKILCESMFIQRHLYSKHDGITVKRYRTMFNCLSESELGKGNLLKRAQATNSVGDFCKFKCTACPYNSTSISALRRHALSTQHIKGHMGAIEKCATKVMAHECKLCNQYVLCDSFLLRSHLRETHNKMTLEEYGERTGTHLRKAQLMSKFTSTNPLARMSRAIGNKCSFKCTKCSVETSSWKMMRVHRRTTGHKVPKMDFPKCVVKAVFHLCRICSKKLLCDEEILQRHIYAIHSMTFCEYNRKFSLQSKQNDYQESVRRFRKDLPCHIPLNKATLTEKDIALEHTTSHFGNLCEFKCPECVSKTRYLSRRALGKHIALHHKENRNPNAFNHKHVVLAIYHKCFLCDKILLCDYSTVVSHLRGVHNVHIRAYEKMLRDNGIPVLSNGGVATPGSQQYEADT